MSDRSNYILRMHFWMKSNFIYRIKQRVFIYLKNIKIYLVRNSKWFLRWTWFHSMINPFLSTYTYSPQRVLAGPVLPHTLKLVNLLSCLYWPLTLSGLEPLAMLFLPVIHWLVSPQLHVTNTEATDAPVHLTEGSFCSLYTPVYVLFSWYRERIMGHETFL